MGLSDNIFGSDKSSPVPGGSVAKPLIIALLALLASRYMTGSGQQAGAPAAGSTPGSPAPEPTSDPSPGNVLDGLGGLIRQFQQKGLGDTIDTWINTGANRDISSGQVSEALGRDVVDDLSRRTGLSRDEVVAELARMLPNVVDRLTPDGRLPTQREMARLLG